MESLGSVEDVEHVARFLIIAPRMGRALARSVARGVRWDVRDIRRNGTAGSRYGYQESIPSGLWSAITQSAR